MSTVFPSYNFGGKKALVTGACRGFGFDLTAKLASLGATVYAISRDTSPLVTLKEKYPSLIHPIKCDLSDWKATEKAVENLETVDYLVNNAGMAVKEDFFDISEANIDLIFGINVKALINLTKLVSKKMVDAGKKGCIVNVSSVSSQKQYPGLLTYCTSKAAVDMVTKCSAIELAPHGIRVNSINPTIVMTDMGHQLWDHIADEAKASIPLGDFPKILHCTEAILFLLSDASAFSTGAYFPVDGGKWVA